MSERANIETVRRFYAAGPSDDDALRRGFATSEVVWHVPGHSRVSRDYVGPTDVFETMGAAMQPLDLWDIVVEAIMANRDLVFVRVRLRARRGERSVDCTAGHVFRMVDGRIAEAWGFVEDQLGLDALFDS